MNWIVKIVLGLAVIFVLGLSFLNYRAQRGATQKEFLAGEVPLPSNYPQGKYNGTVGGYETMWKGKKFNRDQATGINLIESGSKIEEKYPFKTSQNIGLKDKQIQVIKIDYDIPENPFWVRMVLDEIVMVAPNRYLGKVHVRVLPAVTFTLGYFDLTKAVNE